MGSAPGRGTLRLLTLSTAMGAFIFMPALAGAAIFSFVFILFLANYYLTVLEGTATGAKHVTWLSEPIIDNFGSDKQYTCLGSLVLLW